MKVQFVCVCVCVNTEVIKLNLLQQIVIQIRNNIEVHR